MPKNSDLTQTGQVNIDQFALANSKLLSGLKEEVLELISSDLQDVRSETNEVLFEAGEPGDAVYLIVSGTVRIERDGIELVSLESGQCFGEFALIDDGPRSASAITNGPTQLLRWERKDFQRTLYSHPEVASGMLKILTQKLRGDVDRQVEVGIERAKLQYDLQRAKEVQMAMLPEKDIATDKIEISGVCRPAEEVGGDYYDYVLLPDGKIAIVIADVMGHGFYSGLLVAMAKSCVLSRISVDAAPEKVMEALNQTVSLSLGAGMLMTGCYVRFDPAAARLSYSNAGHNYPLLLHGCSGDLEFLESTDPLLGLPGFEGSARNFASRAWELGDTLLMYSDGITESTDLDGEMFGEGRLRDALVASAGRSANEVRAHILETLENFTSGSSQDDDITLVVARAK